MKVTVVAKNIQLTPALKESVEKKISKLDRYFEPEVQARATLSVQKNRQIVEVTIPFNGVILRGEESTEDMYKSIDLVEDKLERQIRYPSFNPKEVEEILEEDENKIVKTKNFYVKPMSSEEAILQMELLGHNFFVYEDSDTNKFSVMYKRKDGNYGLIEPDYK